MQLANEVATADVVFLIDVDNTLLDNDRIIADLRQHLEDKFGARSAARYWVIFEQLREELGYADYLGALQRYRNAVDYHNQGEQRLLLMSSFLVDYPFVDRLYADAVKVLAHLNALAPTVILSDGDVVFQPRKVQRAGLWDAVGGKVLIYVHKEKMLEHVQSLYPARHYVMIDDKLRILAAMKEVLGERLTTVFPRQGHYAHDPQHIAGYPPADHSVERIGDLLSFDTAMLLGDASQEIP